MTSDLTHYIIGAAGYLGSHVAASLLARNQKVVAIDNFSTGLTRRTRALEESAYFEFISLDAVDHVGLGRVFNKHGSGIVYHFAALKDASESISKPEIYFINNTELVLSCLDAMERSGLNRLVYSSSAAVYGEPDYLPVDTRHPTNPISPYGASKLICERIISGWCRSYGGSSVILRYFNPVGCGADTRLGYDYQAKSALPLFPAIARSALCKSEPLNVYRAPSATRDGSGVRDFIHVDDLAEAHLAAAHANVDAGYSKIVNLGTGIGVTVLEVVGRFNELPDFRMRCEERPERPGDISESFCDREDAFRLLGWRPRRNLNEMCQSEWDAARQILTCST